MKAANEGRGCVRRVTACMLAAALWTVTATPARAVDNPTVDGPITGGIKGHALWDSWFELGDIGYTEAEYFISGLATDTPAGPTTTPYTTRIIVTRPVDAADYNGTVVVEWVNVTAQFENAVDIITTHELLLREGYAYVHVSAQSAGLCCSPLTPQIWDPVRYAPMSHPGDAFSFEMFAQIVQALKSPDPAFGPDPMNGFGAEKVIAVGQSQSAGRLDTYVRQWQPVHDVIDGFIIHGGGSKAYSPPPPVPVVHLLSDFEANSSEPTTSTNYSLWEVAGSAHSDFYIGYHQVFGQGPRSQGGAAKEPASADDDMHVIAGNYGEQIHPNQETCTVAGATFPMRYAAMAALTHLSSWVRGGPPPPQGPRYEFSNGALALDQYGNALGGIRLPPIDVPVARYASTACGLGGKTFPFTEAELAVLYPTHTDYLCQMQEKTDEAVAAGFMLPADADDLMTRVAAATNRWAVQGTGDCGNDCGDGVVDPGEQCDDANATGGDGCSDECQVETCYTCNGAPSICAPTPGAGCDDGNECSSNDTCDAGAVCTGTPDIGEACDDGNVCTGPDVCDAGTECSGTISIGAACDDGNVCTGGDLCDASGLCVGGGPPTGCSEPERAGRASLKLRKKTTSSGKNKDSLKWKWSHGSAFKEDFGNPTASTDYSLCVTDGGSRLLMRSAIPAGPGWRNQRPGYLYRDKTLANGGIGKVQLKEGVGRARIKAQGKGSNLDMAELFSPQPLPVTVAITNGAECWQATYGSDVKANGSGRFQARSD